MAREKKPLDEATSLRRTHQTRFEDMVRDISAFHVALAGRFEMLAFQASADTNKMLFRFYMQHERGAAADLQQFIEDCPNNLRDRWFKYSPEIPLDQLDDHLDLQPDMEPARVAEVAVRANRALEIILTPSKESAVTEDLNEALSNLRKREREHAKRGASAATRR